MHYIPTYSRELDSVPGRHDDAQSIVQPGDDTADLRAAQKEESRQRLLAESDIAAGYFAVCREYTPMGINAKPIERSTPVGSATVAAPSPSVYQSMYRSIFDKKPAPSPLDDGKNVSQRPKKAGNVFYVVLRHGHLMLFDDDEQLEVRHVISLAHHHVSIYSGGDRTPEGELYIKRNAICLSRRADKKDLSPDSRISKPFYLFSENCSAKEDFYFSLLRNQEQFFTSQNLSPRPQRFEVRNIISLVQKLHSSEDQLQTRWLNAFIGRMFLGVHKTKDIENLIREKITKKISRVNRPSFLTRIAIQNIDTGDSAPYITNPRLKDLGVEGECVMEADVKYTGNFRLEVAATARIDLGTRFKSREVNLVLAVVLRKLEGHVFFKIKPPPSNRIWFSFQTMPKLEMAIEPIVSSRQITYTLILRQIENRIKEVVAETLVSPFWDDLPFFNTEHKRWRGGIFEGDDAVVRSADHEAIAAQLGDVDEVAQMEQNETLAPDPPPMVEKTQTFPTAETNSSSGFWSRRLNPRKPAPLNGESSPAASTTAIEGRKSSSAAPEVPRPIRSGSFSASSPVVGTDPAHADTFRPSSSPPDRDDAMSKIVSISARSQNNSPAQTPIESPSKASSVHQPPNYSSGSSSEALPEVDDNDRTPTAQGRRHTASSSESLGADFVPPGSPSHSTRSSIASGTASIGRSFFARKDLPSSPAAPPSGTPEQKRGALTAVSNAAAAAKRWGIGAMQRQNDMNPRGRKLSDPAVDLNLPMGRGQPLPPPGTPLPGPGKKSSPVPAPKCKPTMRPPAQTRKSSTSMGEEHQVIPSPPLPRRRRVSRIHAKDSLGAADDSNVMVVEAPPPDSESDSPLPDSDNPDRPTYVRPWIEDGEELEGSEETASTPGEPSSVEGGGALDFAGDDEEGYSNWIEDSVFQGDTKVTRS
ncbi:hypothetical protein F4778DRAFT_625112 [Xylariomycetidae sp. FL2044]|nr:hypothetical protein F4778DRAFT_625112 [Xylariomycetidae sp. FL2044]